MARNLWVSLYILSDDEIEKLATNKDGETVFFLPREKRKEFERKASESITKNVSRYVSAHPEKYLRKEGIVS